LLRRVFGPKRQEVKGRRRKFCNKELHKLYSSLNIVNVSESKMIRWAGYVERMGREKI
jgi:hypothetical protein